MIPLLGSWRKNNSPPPVTKLAVETIKDLSYPGTSILFRAEKIALMSVHEMISIKSKTINLTA